MEEQRFIDIETKLLHQENMLEELHQVVYRQQEEIVQLEKALKNLTSRLQEATAEGLEVGPADDKPPHY